jgi:hypothetical protein
MKTILSFLLLISLAVNAQNPSYVNTKNNDLFTYSQYATGTDGILYILYNQAVAKSDCYNVAVDLAALPSGYVPSCISVISNTLYVGGRNTNNSSNFIITYSGSSWSNNLLPIIYLDGSSTVKNWDIHGIEAIGSTLYFLGDSSVYKKSGSTITVVATANNTQQIKGIKATSNYLYFWGNFTNINGNSTYKYLSRYNGSALSQVAPSTFSIYNNTTGIVNLLDGGDGYLYSFGTIKGSSVADSGSYRFAESNLANSAYKFVPKSSVLKSVSYYGRLFILSHNTTKSDSIYYWTYNNVGKFAISPSNSTTQFNTGASIAMKDTSYLTAYSGNNYYSKKLVLPVFSNSVTTTQPSCYGGTFSATVTTTYTIGVTNRWYDGSNNLIATGNTYSNSGFAGNGTLYCISTDNYGRQYKTSIPVVIPAQITFTVTASPESATGANNGKILAKSSNTSGTLSWGSGSTSYTSPNTYTVTGLAHGTYTVTLTNSNSCVATKTVTIGLTNLPPATPTITATGTTMTSSAVSGNQWYFNNNIINGATSQNYTATQDGNYTVKVTTAGGTVTSTPYNMTLPPPTPTISVSGATLTSSSSTGNQWYFNGNIINGATGQSYTATQDGSYVVKVTNGGGTTASAPYSMTLPPPTPTISVNGATMTSSSSTGNQWYFNNSIINGATGQSYTATQDGSYVVKVTNGVGTTASAPYSMTLSLVAPSTPTISVNGTVLTSSSTTGNQWYLNGNIINGATGQTYTVTENGSYTVVVTNGVSSATSVAYVITSFTTTPTAIETNTNNISIVIYPNPTSGIINIEGEFKEAKIFNSTGELILVSKEKAVDISGLTNGVYFIEIDNKFHKIIKLY